MPIEEARKLAQEGLEAAGEKYQEKTEAVATAAREVDEANRRLAAARTAQDDAGRELRYARAKLRYVNSPASDIQRPERLRGPEHDENEELFKYVDAVG